MFRDILEQLGKGVMPEKKGLAGKFEAALIKKIGVLQIPYHSQPIDPKINPPAGQMLVVAALLGNREKIRLVRDILQTELLQKKRGQASEDISSALIEAQNEVSRLLAPFPEELNRWLQILAEF